MHTRNFREIGAKISTKLGGGLEIQTSTELTWQLIEAISETYLNKVILFKALITPTPDASCEFCLHHFGNVDFLRISKDGEITFSDSRHLQSVKVSPKIDGSFAVEAHFQCFAAGFSFGTACPTSYYTGDGNFHFVLNDLDIQVLRSVSNLQVLYNPVSGRRRQSPTASHEIEEDLVRIAVPVHPPKAIWLNQLLLSIDRVINEGSGGPAEIVLFLTSQEDAPFFSGLCATLNLSYPVSALYIRELIRASPELRGASEHFDSGAAGGMAVFKKLVGLYALARADEADRLTICIDADTLCLRWDHDLGRRLRRNYEEKRFFGASVDRTSVYQKINDAAFRQIAPLVEISGDEASTYTWFFEVPTYSSNDFMAFISHVSSRRGGLAEFFKTLNWYTFEHTMFVYFLMRHGGKLQSYQKLSRSIPEGLRLEEIRKISERYDYIPLWMTAAAYFREPILAADILPVYFLSHFDRFGIEA